MKKFVLGGNVRVFEPGGFFTIQICRYMRVKNNPDVMLRGEHGIINN